MDLTDEQRAELQRRLDNLREQHDALLKQAEQGLAQLDGAIAVVRSLLEQPPEQEPEINK